MQLQCWGGATFDVAFRFLHEDAWERLRKLRKAIPNVCFQMLIRGANAVGYTSYPDNVVKKFCHLAAKNGMDVFRIFDCFNQLNCMQNCIEAVREANKVAEVCICYTGDFRESAVYTLDYYKEQNEEALRQRLALYHAQTEPVLAHYKELGKDLVQVVDANQKLEQVWAQIEALLPTLEGSFKRISQEGSNLQ